MLQNFPNKSLGLFLTDIFWRGFPSAEREQCDLFIFKKIPYPNPLDAQRSMERGPVSLARPGPPALPEAGRHGGLLLLAPPHHPRACWWAPSTPLSAHSHPRAHTAPWLRWAGDQGAVSPAPRAPCRTGWDRATTSPMSKISIFMLWYLFPFPFPFLPFCLAGGGPGGFQASDRACNHLPALTTGLHHLPMPGRRPRSVLGCPPGRGGHPRKGVGEAGRGCSRQGPAQPQTPLCPSTSPEIPYFGKQCRGLSSVGRG